MLTKFCYLLLFFSQGVAASPWWTGPLLAPAGKTIPQGHVNFEPYGFYTLYAEQFRNFEALPIVTLGILDFLDIQASVPYDVSWKGGQSGKDFGDSSFGVGLQLFRQKENSWVPNVRLLVQEIFPSGKFNHLNPNKLGTDQTGIGSYQTLVGLNFQKLTHFYGEHYLRTRLGLAVVSPSDVLVEGFNAFGGSPTTHGKVKLNNSYSVNLAFEYSLTQHWAPVFELLYTETGTSTFAGNPGFTPGGAVGSIGSGGSSNISLAPALEYNFNESIGIIAGVWFSVTGPHAARFVSNVIALNIYF